MNWPSEKIVGYILIFIGVLTIFLSTLSVYNVFTGNSAPASLISQSDKPLNLSLGLPNDSGGVTSVPLSGNNPLSSITQEVNLIVHLVLMSFIASAGYKLALIGTRLVRPIVVKAKS